MAPELKEIVVHTFKVNGADTLFQTHIRVVKWMIRGVETPMKLEKRAMLKQEDGTFKLGKRQAFTVDDVKFIVENSLDVIELMEGKIKSEDIHD